MVYYTYSTGGTEDVVIVAETIYIPLVMQVLWNPNDEHDYDASLMNIQLRIHRHDDDPFDDDDTPYTRRKWRYWLPRDDDNNQI